MTILRGCVASLLLMVASRALIPFVLAQDGGSYIPEETCTYHIRPLPGPFEEAAGALLLSAALLPLIVAWSSLQSGKYAVARRWTGAALVVACGQGLYAVVLLMDPRTAVAVPSWFPGKEELRDLLNEKPGWAVFLGVGVLGAVAAGWTLRVVDARRASPPKPVAGTRIRVKEKT